MAVTHMRTQTFGNKLGQKSPIRQTFGKKDLKSVLVIRIGAKFKDAVAKAIPIVPNRDSVSFVPKYKTRMTKPV